MWLGWWRLLTNSINVSAIRFCCIPFRNASKKVCWNCQICSILANINDRLSVEKMSVFCRSVLINLRDKKVFHSFGNSNKLTLCTYPLHNDDKRLTYFISVSNNSLTTLSRITSLLCDPFISDVLIDRLKASANSRWTTKLSSLDCDAFRLSKSFSLVFGSGGMI